MTIDPRTALGEFIEALQEHLAAAADRSGDHDTRVEAGYSAVADAFEVYEDALYTEFDEVLPFELFDDIEDAKDNADDDDSEDDESDDDDSDDEVVDEEDLEDDYDYNDDVDNAEDAVTAQ